MGTPNTTPRVMPIAVPSTPSEHGSTITPAPLFTEYVPAGFPSPADDYIESQLDLNKHLVRHPSATFFVRVTGDSMIGAGIFSGDILIVDRSLEAEDKRYPEFDRFGHIELSRGKELGELLDEFRACRAENIEILSGLELTDKQLAMTGIHPRFGEVTLRQQLTTWVTHDLGHIGQVVRVMAKQYREEAGPWTEYLRILRD